VRGLKIINEKKGSNLGWERHKLVIKRVYWAFHQILLGLFGGLLGYSKDFIGKNPSISLGLL